MSLTSTEVRVRWERRAVRETAALAKNDRRRIFGAVETLRLSPLRGKVMRADWQGFLRLRVGHYRIVYAFDGQQLLISVVRVGNRREVYR